MINIASYSAYQARNKIQNENLQHEFTLATGKYFNLFSQLMESKLYVVRTVNAYFQGSQFVTREGFKDFSQVLLEGNPDIQALNWLPKIIHSKRAAYEQRMRSEGFENFTIMARTADNLLVVSPDKQVYFPIEYVEPFEENKRV
ncbi:MAG: CHASE domain-containing protein, partial [Gammaproteobacteria bacterium]|nr:CHASE domain-containing protein [Gammaproteobacteria bacterium]